MMSLNISGKYTASICRMSAMNIKAADCSEMVIPSTKPCDIFQKSIIFHEPFLTKILFPFVTFPADSVTPPISFSLTYHFSSRCWRLWLSGTLLQFCSFISSFLCLLNLYSIMFLIAFSLWFYIIVWGSFFVPYNMTCQIIILCIFHYESSSMHTDIHYFILISWLCIRYCKIYWWVLFLCL